MLKKAHTRMFYSSVRLLLCIVGLFPIPLKIHRYLRTPIPCYQKDE